MAAVNAIKDVSFDRDFKWFREALIGRPILVHSVSEIPAYWLFPVQRGGQVGGFVQVLQDGTAGMIGKFGGVPDSWPSVVTGIDAEEAMRRAKKMLVEGEQASQPIFVHDGPPGREAWMVTTSIAGIAARALFITPGFTYERRAGESLNINFE